MPVQKKHYDREEVEAWARRNYGTGLDSYIEWCRRVGLDPTWQKTPTKLQREMERFREDRAKEAFDKRRKEPKNVRDLIRDVLDNPSKYKHTYGIWEHWAWAVNALFSIHDDADAKAAFSKIVDVLYDNHSKMLEDEGTLKALIKVAMWNPYWVREPKEWSPNSYSIRRQKASLLRHLFAKYSVPAFMDSAWDSEGEKSREWYVHIAQGANIRTARFLPFPLTKKMAHHFLEAPERYSVLDALMYGQVVALGGNEHIANNLRGTRILRLGDEFRQSFIKFLIENPMLDPNQYAPILDYVWAMKDGQQPNFSMHGRSAEALMDQVERWHRQLNKARMGKKTSWSHSVYEDFRLEEGEAGSKGHRLWVIAQLVTSNELFDEGRAMKHCVSSYAASCAAGSCTVWSLRRHDSTGDWRLITIEENHGRIMQARGMINRRPTPQEWNVISRWAIKNKLTIPEYLK